MKQLFNKRDQLFRFEQGLPKCLAPLPCRLDKDINPDNYSKACNMFCSRHFGKPVLAPYYRYFTQIITISIANNSQKTTNKTLDNFLSLASLLDLAVLKTGSTPAAAYAPNINFNKTESVPLSWSIL